MKIKKISHLTYHRNGVCGEGFYSCILTLSDKEFKALTFLATFDCDENDNIVSNATCRIVCIEKPSSNWRGDEFAYTLTNWFKTQTGIKSWYDLVTPHEKRHESIYTLTTI